MTENKPIIRSICIKGDILSKKIEVVSKLIYGDLPPNELNTLAAIITYQSNNSLFITPIISEQIRIKFGISKTGLSTSLHRLCEKKLIRKDGKTITLNPAFSGLNDMDKLLISFHEGV